MLGQRALLDRRLQMDHVLWDMIRKIFPRPELEVEIEKRKLQVKPLSPTVYGDVLSGYFEYGAFTTKELVFGQRMCLFFRLFCTSNLVITTSQTRHDIRIVVVHAPVGARGA